MSTETKPDDWVEAFEASGYADSEAFAAGWGARTAALTEQPRMGHYIYIPSQQRGYIVEDLNEATDDLTNYECEVTPLIAAPSLPETSRQADDQVPPEPDKFGGKLGNRLRNIMKSVDALEAKTGHGGAYAESIQESCNAIARDAGLLSYFRRFHSAAPQAATIDPLAQDVEAALRLLADHEWAEHFAKTELGKRLESAITDLHNEIIDSREAP